MSRQALWKAFVCCSMLSVGAVLGVVGSNVYWGTGPNFVGLKEYQVAVSAAIALLAAVGAFWGVNLQINAARRAKEDDRRATSESIGLLITQQIRDVLFAIEYQAQYMKFGLRLAPKEVIANTIEEYRLLGKLSSEAVKRTWEALGQCSAETRLEIAQSTSILDKLSKSCQQSAFALDLLKDHVPSAEDMSLAEFFIRQRDLVVESLKGDGLYTDEMEAIRDRAVMHFDIVRASARDRSLAPD